MLVCHLIWLAQVKGVYFCIGNRWSGHYNSVKFDASSMRAFSANSYGYIAMTTSKDALKSVNIDQEDGNGDNSERFWLSLPTAGISPYLLQLHQR